MVPGSAPVRCNASVFISDEVRAEAPYAQVVARLADVVPAGWLTRASHDAWDAAAAAARTLPGSEPPGLGRVYCRGPVRRGAVAVLIVRWEAAGPGGTPFPVLDADISVVPDEDAALIGVAGVFRTSVLTPAGQPAARTVAAAAVRTLLIRIADAVSLPAASEETPEAIA
jgi:hypothetical protein